MSRATARPLNGGVSYHSQLRLVREKARKRGAAALEDAVEFTIHCMQNSAVPWRDRLFAACEIMNRFGLPKLEQTQDVSDAIAVPKLFLVAAPPSAPSPGQVTGIEALPDPGVPADDSPNPFEPMTNGGTNGNPE